MSELREDQRLALANMHALAQATLRARDAQMYRARLEALADYAPDAIVLTPDDPRSDEALGLGVAPAAAVRRYAARVRGVVLGCAAHRDGTAREAAVLAYEAVRGEGPSEKDVEKRVTVAFVATRDDLEEDLVRLGSSVTPPDMRTDDDAAWIRRWGGTRTLELNAFVASLTRDGTHGGARRATREGPDAGALRFALAVSQAALSLPAGALSDDSLASDVRRTDVALPALLAALIQTARE